MIKEQFKYTFNTYLPRFEIRNPFSKAMLTFLQVQAPSSKTGPYPKRENKFIGLNQSVDIAP